MKLYIFLFTSLFVFGCSTSPDIRKARNIQYSLVDNLNSNHVTISKEAISLYEKQAKEDIEFIYELVKDEDVDRARALKIDKLNQIDINVKKLREQLKKNELNFEQYKELQEALK